AVDAGLEHCQHDHIRVRVGSHGTNLDAHALFVADRNADHGAAINSRRLDLVWRLEVRIETAISVHAGIQQQANIVPVSENAVHERPSELAELLFAFGIPEKVFAVFANGNVGMHSAAVHTHDGLGQEGSGKSHVRSNLAADQLIKLDLVGSSEI